MSLHLPRVEATYKCFSVLRAEKTRLRERREKLNDGEGRREEKKRKGDKIEGTQQTDRRKERKRERERERLNIFLTTFLSLIHYSSIATKRVVAHEL